MTLQVGRVKIGDQFGTPVHTVKTAGDTITIAGHIDEPTGALGEAKARQIANLLDNSDEKFVPVVRTDGPLLAGFFRVKSASTDRESGLGARGTQPFSLQIERIENYAAPLLEALVFGGRRDGIVAGHTPQPFHGLPALVQGYEVGINQTPNTAIRKAEDGDVVVFTSTDNQTFMNAVPSFFIPPADWYSGAATVSMDGQPVVGREVPNRPANWRISNGIVRMSGSSRGILLEGWSGTAWANPRTMRPHRRLSASEISYLDEPHTVTVLKNAPEEVIVRLTYDAASNVLGSRFACYLDLTLRRGSRTVGMRFFTRGYYAWGYELEGWGTGTTTTLTGGSTLNGVVLARDPGMSFSSRTANNVVIARTQYVIGTTVYVSALGYAPATTGIDAPQAVLEQWAASQVEQVEAVAR